MSPFEKWWKTTEWTEMDGPVPYKAAKEAWDAALTLASEAVLNGTYWDLDRMVS